MAVAADERAACCHATVARHINSCVVVAAVSLSLRLHGTVTQRPLYQQRRRKLPQLRQLEYRHDVCDPSIRRLTRCQLNASAESLDRRVLSCRPAALSQLWQAPRRIESTNV